MSTETSPLIGLYQLCLLAEQKGLLGAPTFHLGLLVNAPHGTVTGQVHITQAVTPPSGAVTVNVTGTLHELVFGPTVTKVLTLSGQYIVSFPPPAIGSYLAHFSATIVFHGNGWVNGLGNFHWANHIDNNVPTNSIACPK
ncbi:DUF1842 domain-containing protein [uncultured Mucilaginibacter sp.]|uniref:DUF1842 domain-containing protein n=1 Tax=uncultured Mucilaginibacter sp. TaxID=797541 RepID=UPI0025E9599E|nr:DUF1842 domain-containing protein [uncultured Mucilaginibacter sp.]